MRRRALAAALAAGLLVRSAFALAPSQGPPVTFVVGESDLASAVSRGDTARTGFARQGLPRGVLSVAWQAQAPSDAFAGSFRGPFETASGDIVVVSPGATVFTFAADGRERARVETHAGEPGAPALLADGTVVFRSAQGEIVGARGESVIFRSRVFQRGGGPSSGILPLRSSGFAIASGDTRELLEFDHRGALQRRVRTPEAVTTPLLAHGDDVVAIGDGGSIYLWGGRANGESSLRTIGRFDTIPDAPPLLLGDQLLAIVRSELWVFDIATGRLSVSHVEGARTWIGPLAATPSGEIVGPVEPWGLLLVKSRTGDGDRFGELRSTSLAEVPMVPATTSDLRTGRRDVGPFAASDGSVVVATSDGTVIRWADSRVESVGPFCPARGLPLAGIAPTHDGEIVVLCEGGQLARVRGDGRSLH